MIIDNERIPPVLYSQQKRQIDRFTYKTKKYINEIRKDEKSYGKSKESNYIIIMRTC